MVLTITAIIALIIITLVTGLVFISMPLFILLGTILVGWGIKTGVEWLIVNINYKEVAAKTVEQAKKFAEKIKIEEGTKIIKESIEELKGKK